MTPQQSFEQWITQTKSKLFLSQNDHPSFWRGSKEEIAQWENNPYSHPWTAGAYESWKYFRGDEK